MPRLTCLVAGLALSSLLSGCVTSTPMTYQQWKAKLERLARTERIRRENDQVRRENRVVITVDEQRRSASGTASP